MTISRPRVVFVAALGLLGVSLALYIARGPAYPTNGPLPRTDEAGVEMELANGAAATWGMPLPGSSAGHLALRSVEPLSVEGVEVLGVNACHPSGVPDAGGGYTDCAPVGGPWPPEGTTLVDVAGAVVEPGNLSFVSVVIGVRRQPAATVSRIGAVRIVYSTGAITYEVVEPWGLRLVDPKPSGQG